MPKKAPPRDAVPVSKSIRPGAAAAPGDRAGRRRRPSGTAGDGRDPTLSAAAPKSEASIAAAPADAVDTAARAKPKLVRDSFTIPKDEYALLGALKARSIALARPAKKSEILRAGIAALHAMSDRHLRAALDAVPSLKTGRPKTGADDDVDA